ncbi:amino acid adenylation domain-containing protein [Kitasatospora sp. McL0602]|uniref:amino acid adenylation domain-containing protein n=1 Tax=Kitasatospora sp. McL0602 TaxID=3439530 RepID=UPI003F8AD3B9
MTASAAQLEIWLADQCEPDSGRYNISLALRFGGPVDQAALRLALADLLVRHPAVAGRFETVDGTLHRIAEPGSPVPLNSVQGSGPYSHEEAVREAAGAATRPLDPGSAPLLRADLLNHPDAALLVLTVHHIVADGDSMGLLTDDLLSYYRARTEGRDPQPTPVSADPVADAGTLEGWRGLLDGEPAVLAPLPDLVRAEGGARGAAAWAERELPAERLTAVRGLAARAGVSTAVTLLAAWSLLLNAWSGEQDGVLGMPFSGRYEPGSEGVVGLFTRVLPIRSDFRPERGFDAHAALLRDQVLDAMEALAEHGAPPAGSAPAYSAVFLHQPALRSDWELGDLTVSQVEIPGGAAKFDLALAAVESAEGLRLRVDHDSSLYTTATAELMLEQLDGLLAAAAREDTGCLELLAGLAPTGAGAEEPAPGAPSASARTVAELVLDQAKRAPDAVAVTHHGESVSYRELTERAAQAAHWLRTQGVRTDDVVVLLLRPGIPTVTMMLAVALAGAAYLPLDPAYPDAQLALVLGDARPRLVVTEPDEQGRVRATGLPVHSVPEITRAARCLPVLPPVTSAGPLTAFNVLYTSGSTGRPKGVVLHHGGVIRMMHRPDFLPIGPDETFSHLSPLNFDGATYEIWGALTHGARLAVLDKELVLSPTELRTAVRELSVTTLLVTTPLLNRIIEDAPDLLQSLRRVYFGGELISVPHITRALRWVRPGTLLHSYGPTENSFTSSWHPITEVPSGARTLPIGRAVPESRLQVVFEGTSVPTPPYVPGELVLGGTGVARGYLGDPQRTAERFAPDPFSDAEGARLYRTGDRVRWTADGELEFIGRADNQVKIRSQRVELGEVEAALRAHPDVRAGFVTSRVNRHGEKEIVGYAVLDRLVGTDELLAHLASVLPRFAVPSYLLLLDELPLTPNGKIDRRRLPAPGRTEPAAAPVVAAEPAELAESTDGDLTATVTSVWHELLDGRPFGPDSNFFDVGGHSLMLVKLREALRRATGTQPTIADLLRHTTVRAQTRLLGGAEAEQRPVRAAAAPRRRAEDDDAIAVVGMGARFAGASDLSAYWANLVAGRDCYTEGSGPVVTELPDGTRRVARWGMLDSLGYDADLLGFGPEDLRSGDVQHGVLHEVLWSAVEDASLRLSDIAHRTSVYAGCPRIIQNDGDARVDDVVSSDPTFVASRFAYLNDLWGEALLLDTACSTGLYAVHLACRSLRSGDSDYALAGAVSLDGSADGSYRYRPGFLYANDGHCRPFDRRATGTVGGFGAGALLLRRLSDAQRDGDPVYAVIRGSAVNNDGRARVGYSAPGVEGQARVIREALAAAGLTGADLGYVEAHGTGTRLGDAIEATALGEALGSTGPGLAIGSVKASIGHCNTAAGIAGLIKAVLAVHHGYLPATPGVSEPIEELTRFGPRFSLLAEGRPWEQGADSLRTAGVSSFGVGGTNAHLVVQQHRTTAAPERV